MQVGQPTESIALGLNEFFSFLQEGEAKRPKIAKRINIFFITGVLTITQ